MQKIELLDFICNIYTVTVYLFWFICALSGTIIVYLIISVFRKRKFSKVSWESLLLFFCAMVFIWLWFLIFFNKLTEHFETAMHQFL